jgi:hypothetical protein
MTMRVAGAFVNGHFAFVTADLFPTRIRFSGVAVVQNIIRRIRGTAPLVATALVEIFSLRRRRTRRSSACGR